MRYNSLSGRSHQVTIFFSLGRVLYLIVIPVSRGVITALQGGIQLWAMGTWADILVLIFMAVFALASWRRCVYQCSEFCLSVRSGVFWKRHTSIPWESISTLSVTTPFYLRPLRASLLRACTIAGNRRHADASIYIHTSAARKILEFYEDITEEKREGVEGSSERIYYMPKLPSIAAFALLSSNTLAGIIFIATFISQSGRILGDEFSEWLITSFERISRDFAMGIPPAAAAMAYAILFGWLIALAFMLTRYHRFKLEQADGRLYVSSGFFTKREYIVRKSHISYTDIRQTLGTRILRLYTLYIRAPGYADQKDDISCVLPARKKDDFMGEYAVFFPEITPAPRQIKPARRGIWGYILQPLILCGVIAAAALLLFIKFEAMRDFILFAALMLLAPGLLFLAVRLIDFRSGGISCEGDVYTLRYSRGFKLHTIIAPREKVVKATLRQNPIQRRNGNCNLTIYTEGVRADAHTCRNMIRGEVKDIAFVVARNI